MSDGQERVMAVQDLEEYDGLSHHGDTGASLWFLFSRWTKRLPQLKWKDTHHMDTGYERIWTQTSSSVHRDPLRQLLLTLSNHGWPGTSTPYLQLPEKSQFSWKLSSDKLHSQGDFQIWLFQSPHYALPWPYSSSKTWPPKQIFFESGNGFPISSSTGGSPLL